jgi:four helix bundle protein
MKHLELENRTKQLSVRIIKLYAYLPNTGEAQVIGKQFLRSATSIGAHCREASFARTKSDYIFKIDAGLQELAKTGYWLELLAEAKIIEWEKLTKLFQEIKELSNYFVEIIKQIKNKS